MKIYFELNTEHTKVVIETTKLPKLDVSPAAIEMFLTGVQHGYLSSIADLVKHAAQKATQPTPEPEPEPETEDVPGYPRWFVCQRTSLGGLHWLQFEEEDGTVVRTEDVTQALTFATSEGPQRFIEHWWNKSLSTRTRSGKDFECASWEIWRQASPGGWLVPNVQHDLTSIPFGPERSDDGH